MCGGGAAAAGVGATSFDLAAGDVLNPLLLHGGGVGEAEEFGHILDLGHLVGGADAFDQCAPAGDAGLAAVKEVEEGISQDVRLGRGTLGRQLTSSSSEGLRSPLRITLRSSSPHLSDPLKPPVDLASCTDSDDRMLVSDLPVRLISL